LVDLKHGEKAGWLVPVPLEMKRQKVREKATSRRAGTKCCLPILDRLHCSDETWFDLVRNFRKRIRNEAGSLLSVRSVENAGLRPQAFKWILKKLALKVPFWSVGQIQVDSTNCPDCLVLIV
jgi:hypothetical protein